MTYRLITFDVFSALGDINGTFVPMMKEINELEGKDLVSIFQTWRSKQYEYMIFNNSLEKGFMSFEEITSKTLDYALFVNNVDIPKEDKIRLVKGWRKIKLWEEARDVLDEVKKRGYVIGMLSNGDYDVLDDLQDSFGITFDHIFSAEQVKIYKPSPKMYGLPLRELGLEKGDYLHVAGSTPDIFGAISAGIPCAWSNRHNQVPIDINAKPTYNLQNLSDLLSYI